MNKNSNSEEMIGQVAAPALSCQEALLIVAFLSFLFGLAFLAKCIVSGGKHHEWALKIVAVLSVIGAVVLVSSIGLPLEYLTASIGLLGSVAGFALRGRSDGS